MWWANELWDGAIPATFERRGLSLSSPTVSERHAIRTGALAVTAAATVLPILMPVPRRLPATAMGSELLLYLERGLAVFAILVFLLVFLYRSLLHGELPKAISSRGAEWTDLIGSSGSTSSELQKQVDDLDAAVKRILEVLRAHR